MTWDDPSIPDVEVLYRRVPDKPDFLVPDLLGDEKRPSRTAFQWDPDGISVYRESLLQSASLDASAVAKIPTHMVFGFCVVVPRFHGAGVVNDPVEDDPPAGFAHALVRCEKPRPDKTRRREVSTALADLSQRVL